MIEINRDTYPAAVSALANVARGLYQLTEQLDLRKMREICGACEAVAPVIAPSEYQRGGLDNLAGQAAFLAAVDRFVTDLSKLDRHPTPEGTT